VACPLTSSVAAVAGGSPERGADEIQVAGRGACHTIPGIDGADSFVGPPLQHWSLRSTIGWHTSNTPEHLIAWLRSPDDIDPGTDMPDLNLTERQARDIAAYLFTLH